MQKNSTISGIYLVIVSLENVSKKNSQRTQGNIMETAFEREIHSSVMISMQTHSSKMLVIPMQKSPVKKSFNFSVLLSSRGRQAVRPIQKVEA